MTFSSTDVHYDSFSSQISALISTQPTDLQALISKQWQRLEERLLASSELNITAWPQAYAESVVDILARSSFVAESLERMPEQLLSWAQNDDYIRCSRTEAQMRESLSAALAKVDDESSLLRCLREFRRQEMVRLIWRDLTGLADLYETIRDVSALADVCIDLTLEYLYQGLCEQHGTPRSRDGRAQRMLVLGMGKLGAHELNVSSDIDLIFAYPENGETDHARKPVDNQRFFTKLGQKLIHALDHVDGNGFVFRVDMRLRPYGSSGALALNFASFEDYYQNQGREWERYAMVKARIITGDAVDKEALQGIIQPFVYRRYTDFSSIEALREMKRLIMSEVHRKGGDQNIKLGSGGIREIEFIAQACQLIHGGRDQSLQLTGLLPVFERLREAQYLPADWVEKLLSANEFLRDLEHAIQGLADKQTQLLPASEQECLQVALSMGFESWAEVLEPLQAHRAAVAQMFADFLDDPSEQSDDQSSQGSEQSCEEQQVQEMWLRLWQAQAEPEQWLEAFEANGFSRCGACLSALEELKDSRMYSTMSAEASQRLERFIALLLRVASEQEAPSIVFVRVMSLVRAILGRTIYLVLLYENVDALKLLCKLCQESPWIAEHLAKSPVILDELLDAHSLYQPPEKDELQDELRQTLLRVPEDDLEAQMDALRHFKQSHMLRVAAAELSGKLPLMKVSDYLTWLAEALVGASVNIAWQNMVDKYGEPSCIDQEQGVSGFAVVGYGKLGGLELNYHSDLDMVFLYRCNENGMTTGERSIANPVFYTRLGQRVIHILATNTTQGELYEVDMRLRPSGNSGMLVSSVAAFERYQEKDAWTWEHQALVRARVVAGDAEVGKAFDEIRERILSQPREPQDLMVEVRDMRQKMKLGALDKFDSAEQARDDIKLGEGGLVDIEFITQYGVLQWAQQYPELMRWSDNVRLLEEIAKFACYGDLEVLPLIDAYRDLRAAQHRKNLADSNYVVSLQDYSEQRQCVEDAWCHIFDVCSTSS